MGNKMRKLLDRLNFIARWRERGDIVASAREEEENILIEYSLRSGQMTAPAELCDAIRWSRQRPRVKVRTRDILVTYKVPLPREYWRHWKHSDAARANMSAAQRRRRQGEHDCQRDADEFTRDMANEWEDKHQGEGSSK